MARTYSPLNPLGWIARYTHWLHTKWPAGVPEKLPIADENGRTNVDGLYIVGDLTGVPLLKLSANAGVEAVRRVRDELTGEAENDVVDLAIVGGGTSGFAAAKEADKLGLKYILLEASEPFSTIVNFPKGKPIYTYPTETPIEGDLELHEKSEVKEGLLEDLREQTVDQGLKWIKARANHIERRGGQLEVVLGGKAEQPDGVNLNGTSFVLERDRIKARRVIVGIGRSGNYRKLGVPDEQLDKVYNRLHDPADYCSAKSLIVGGGDSAMETAIALAECGGNVTLSYRKPEFNRPKPENIEKLQRLAEAGKVDLLMSSEVSEIGDGKVDIQLDGGETKTIENDHVFAMIGREAPLEFFRKSGVTIRNEHNARWWITLAAFLAFCVWLYLWKGYEWTQDISWLNPKTWTAAIKPIAEAYFNDKTTFGYTLLTSMGGASFYYTLAYCICVVTFGITRIRRRRTPYVFWQTVVLMVIQCLPLFILPELLLPWAGRNGWFTDGTFKTVADWFFETYDGGVGEERAYWRSYGFVLAWPLLVYNWFTDAPMWGWLILGFAQTFVIIPAMIFFWGKGAYCGWVCSCGALAETMGDKQRQKMPHGPLWNRLNMIGQVFLAAAVVLMLLRIAGWVLPEGNWFASAFKIALSGPVNGRDWSQHSVLDAFSYKFIVDVLWAGILGVGVYFWLSGRFWCRFACPLAALMHIYSRFGRFAILAEKKKCISCNVCTSVCHQGIDVMSFANKGKPMQDPQCVRCSACVQMCPTGVLSFGRVDRRGNETARDPNWLAASPVRMAESRVELTVNGKSTHR